MPRLRCVFGGAEPVGQLPRLVVTGKFFTLETGEEWTAIEHTDFALFKRYLDDYDIRPILQQRADIGFNLLRVWLLNVSVIDIQPKNYPEFYQKLPAFLDLCASYGLYVELTAFTQAQTLMPAYEDQQAHLDRVVAAVRDKTNVLLELVNENDQHDNAVSDRLTKPEGIICSHGSNGADHAPVRPVWDYEVYHTNDLPEFQRKVGHNAMELADQSGHPCISNENTRYPDRDSSMAHARDAAEGAALLCAGSCFHSVNGKFSWFLDGELDFAIAWVAGARSVPLEYRRGAYFHRADLEGTQYVRVYIRVYERRLGNSSRFVRIRP